MAIVFDLESVASPDAAQFLEEPSAPKNYVDPVKISEYIKTAKFEQLQRAALDPDLCEIVAIGWSVLNEHGAVVEVETADRSDASELLMLARWWTTMTHSGAGAITIGYNSLGFDWPVLIRRSQILGVKHPTVNLDKYRSPHFDLMEKLSFNGKLKYRSLEFYCKRFGIQVEDAVKGADIAQLVVDGNWEAMRGHVRADVERTRQIAVKIGVL